MRFYTSKELKPKGWLLRQLEIQANGLSGNLDKMWKDIADSKWIGGSSEGWERVPYWLDGFVPLAYLLENDDMIAVAKKYINAIIERQCEDGWLCPCEENERKDYDTWAVQLISKVLVVYYECSGDERIPDVLYRAMKNYYDLLSNGTISLFRWGKYRWFEVFIALNFIKERYNEPWITELAKIIDSQGYDYREAMPAWKRPLNKWTFETHVVNMGMMLKYGTVTHDLLDGKYDGVEDILYDELMKYNGTPVGIFTGDECLSGISPIQGTELCAVAELMYSCENLYAGTGNKKWAELLEKVAFNAMPATVSDDMWTHQYVQMSNQMSCERFPGRPLFRTNNPEAHLFGLEPNFGCCTANFNQVFPKFALSAFMHDGDTVISVIPVPCKLDTDGISISVETEYPFKNTIRYNVDTKKAFTLKIRIPYGAENITVNGNPTDDKDHITVDIIANAKEVIDISFTRKAVLTDRPNDLKTVEYGSLVFSLPVKIKKKMYEYEKNGVVRKFPYCDYEYICDSEWRYGYHSDSFTVEEHDIGEYPFSGETPPVTVKAEVVPVEWEFEDGFETVAAKLPTGRTAVGEAKTVDLYPYGCAKLRMTELPFVK